MDNSIPKSVKVAISAAAKDVVAAMRGAGNKTATDINKTASVIEKFMLGIVTDVYPKTKDTWLENDCNSVSDPWLERSAAVPPAPLPPSRPAADPRANKVLEDREKAEAWVKENATKEMYEGTIGGVKSLANALLSKMNNDAEGTFAKTYPEFVSAMSQGSINPAAPAAPLDPKKGLPAENDDVPKSLDEILESMSDSDAEAVTHGGMGQDDRADGKHPDKDGHPQKNNESEQAVDAEEADRPGHMTRKVNEFNTSIEDAPDMPKGGTNL